jgi:hypothetical protein
MEVGLSGSDDGQHSTQNGNFFGYQRRSSLNPEVVPDPWIRRACRSGWMAAPGDFLLVLKSAAPGGRDNVDPGYA